MSVKIEKIALKIYDDISKEWTILYPSTSGDLVYGQVNDSLKLNGMTSDKFMASTSQNSYQLTDSSGNAQGIAASKMVISNDYKNDLTKAGQNTLYVKGKAYINGGKEVATEDDISSAMSLVQSVKVSNSYSADTSLDSDKLDGKQGSDYAPNYVLPTPFTISGLTSAVDLPSGMSFSGIYSNDFPCVYGNCISIKQAGATQIAVEWSGTNGATGNMWFRNARDASLNVWSSWKQIATTDTAITNAGGTINGALTVNGGITGNLTGNASTASSVVGNASNISDSASLPIITGYMAASDAFRILIGSNGSDAGYVEIATADNGNEPIYVRQYSGNSGGSSFVNINNSATLLDANGNTSFPHTVTAPTFNGNLTGTADYANNSGTLSGLGKDGYVEQILDAPQDLANRLPKSGFFQQSTPTANWPTTGWNHLINCQHSNASNNYALQISGGFYDQYLFYRKTNGNGSTGWKRFATADEIVSIGGSTMNGNLTVPSIYSGNWFRSTGDTGWYSEKWGGGWNMSDATWIRAYNGKNVYTSAQMQADGGFNGRLNGCASSIGRNGDNTIPMTFNWAGQGGQPSWLWGGNDGSSMYVYNPSNFNVNYANSATTANNIPTSDVGGNIWIS